MLKFIMSLILIVIVIVVMINPVIGADADLSGSNAVMFKIAPNGFIKQNQPTLPAESLVDSIGTGLNLNNPSLYSLSKSKDTVTCLEGSLRLPSPQAFQLARFSISASCAKALDEENPLYNTENCNLFRTCSQSNSGGFLNNSNSFVALKKLAAQDLASVLLSAKLPTIEKLETLRKYADKKFGKGFANSCEAQFDFKSSKSCSKDLIENGFSNLIQTCASIEKSCYKVGADFGKNNPEGESAMSTFFNQRTDAKVTDALAADNEILDSLAQILVSKESAERRVKAAFDKLIQLNNENKLDPVFGFDSDNFDKMLSSPHYTLFKNLATKKLTTAEIKKEIEKHRLSYAEDILKKKCHGQWSAVGICEKATNSFFGKRQVYPELVAAWSRFKKLDLKQIADVKSAFSNRHLTDKDARIFLNASRCSALGITSNSSISSLVDDFTLSNPEADLGSGIYGVGTAGDHLANFWLIKSPTDNSVIQQRSDELHPLSSVGKIDVQTFQEMGKKDEGSDIVKRGQDEKAPTEQETEYQKISSAIQSHLPVSGSIPSQMDSQNQNSSFTPDNREGDSTKDGLTGAALNDKVSELTKKLSATEKQLSQLQKGKSQLGDEGEADIDLPKVSTKASDEISKEIANLKNKVQELSRENVEAAAGPQSERGAAIAQSSAVVHPTGHQASDLRREEAEKKSPGYSGLGRSVSQLSSMAIADEAQSGKANVSVSSQTGSAGGKNQLVLAKADGMSAEKFKETISEKIVELGGQSFEIEENGIKMEIIPEVKDGKILLDEYGKPRFIKKVKENKVVTGAKNRGPASVTNKADLLRAEEESLKRQRAEYLKLKNLTNEAIKIKD